MKLNEQDREYMDEFQEKILKLLQRKNLKSWKAYEDRMTGAIYFEHQGARKDGNELTVWATPFWEYDEIIPIGIYVETGSRSFDKQIKPIPFRPTGDFNKDAKEYLRKVIPILNSFNDEYLNHWK